jgi:hypothetical protein
MLLWFNLLEIGLERASRLTVRCRNVTDMCPALMPDTGHDPEP